MPIARTDQRPKPTDAVDAKFEPFHVLDRDFLVWQPLPPTSLQLFQLFLPEQLVEQWAYYANEAPEPASAAAKGSRQSQWIPTSAAEIYMWLGRLIYISLHREKCYEGHWKASTVVDGSLIIRPEIS
jgi:hypothetical protein